MELFIIILSLPLFAAALYYLYCRSSTANENLPLPPGPKCWPLFGDLDYHTASKTGSQEQYIKRMTNNYSLKVFKTKVFNEDMLHFCSAEGNKLVFANENKLVKSWFPKTMEKIFATSKKKNDMASIREDILAFRKVVSQFLKPESLRNYINTMDDEVQKHLKTYWHGKDQVTVHPLLVNYTIGLGFRLFLKEEVEPTVKDMLVKDFLTVSGGLYPILPFNLPGTKLNAAIKTARLITGFVEKMVKQRRKQVGVDDDATEAAYLDVLTHLLMEAKANPANSMLANDSDIAKKLYGLVNAAYENPSALVSSIMAYLADLPHVYERVRQEHMEIAKSKQPGEALNWSDIQKMKYTWNVACEVMRLAPPIPGDFREVIKEFVFEGFRIPKGYKIQVNAFATHKNPKYFPDAEKFDPSRFEGEGPAPYTFIPFGGGPRMCPGIEYARLSILVFMHHIVKNFKWEKVIPDEKIAANPISAPCKGLPIRLYLNH